jgi:hypothetical protein
MDYHDDASFHVAPSENAIQSHRSCLYQVSLDLLGQGNPELTLHRTIGSRIESAYSSRGRCGYPFAFLLCLEFLPRFGKVFGYTGISPIKGVYVRLWEDLLLLSRDRRGLLEEVAIEYRCSSVIRDSLKPGGLFPFLRGRSPWTL